MLRIVAAACLSLLLLALQQEALVHPFRHDAARLAERTATLHATADATCATCALIAGGTHGLVGAAPAADIAAPVPYVIARAPLGVDRSHLRYYSSRAPPVLA